MKRGVLFALAAVLLVTVGLAPPFTAYRGGVQIENYDNGQPSCHTIQSSSVVQMSASTSNPAPGAPVTVTVTVTGGEATGAPLGIMLLSALTSTGGMPSEEGWTITADPSGTTAYNYYQVNAYAASLAATWTMAAPATPGNYVLYAREVHGNGDTYTNTNVAGVSFVVGTPGVAPGLQVIITSPAAGEEVSGSIIVNANLIPMENISYAILRIDGVVYDNKTSSLFAWTLDTTTFSNQAHTLNVTAVNATGGVGYDELTIVVNNAGGPKELLTWMLTIGAGSVALVASIGVAIVLALMIRKKIVEGKEVK